MPASAGLHPELRKRLGELGFGADGGRIEPAETSEPSAGCSEQATAAKFSARASKGTDIDSLLSQLDDLDARCKALQGPGTESRSDAPKRSNNASGAGAAAAASLSQPPEKAMPAPRGERRKGHGSSTSCDPAPMRSRGMSPRGVSPRQADHSSTAHPLDGVQLGGRVGSAGGDFRRRQAARGQRDRPPLAPSGGAQTAAAAKPRNPAAAEADSATPRPLGSARQERSKVALPPLKPSASAPGRLQPTKWTNHSSDDYDE
mmetsp:Transcript_30022/g.69930  ORF Transcript_30022/g.69930 Transcript_30022/m.69930 type:complete len:260 (+) Transcript_30022:97-876(+)